MGVSVNTNVSAMTAQRNLSKANDSVANSMERLTTGLRINSAKDDSAGLQISNRLTSQTRGLDVAMRNANDGISMAQTAEGSMQESTNIMQRMRDLSLQATNGSNSDSDREAIQKEVGSLQSELNRIADTTSFGGQNLLDGSYGSQQFQIGSNANQTQSLTLTDISSHAIGRESHALTGITGATQVQAGTATADGKFSLEVDGKSHDIAITKDMTKDDLENKINNIDGISDVSVGDKVNQLATMEVSGLAVNTGETLEMTVAGETVILTDAMDDAGKLAAFETAIADAITADPTLAGMSVTEENGTFTFTGSHDEQQLVIGVDLVVANTAATSVTINGTPQVGDGTAQGAATETSSNAGTANGKTTVLGFEVDFSSAKIDTDVDGLEVTATNFAGTEAPTDLAIDKTTTTMESVASIDVSTSEGAQNAVNILDAALAQVDSQRADLGAFQNRMDHTLSNLGNVSENVAASNGRIKDVDFAMETTKMTKNQILQQASTSILAQAKMNPQAALSLLD